MQSYCHLVPIHGSCFGTLSLPQSGRERARWHAVQQMWLADTATERRVFLRRNLRRSQISPEICAEMLWTDAWRLVDLGRFVRDEDIVLLDARSAL